jgi:hypothetical protein
MADRVTGPTPNGGVASEIFYRDKDGEGCGPEEAATCEIVEYDADGHVIFRTYGRCNARRLKGDSN